MFPCHVNFQTTHIFPNKITIRTIKSSEFIKMLIFLFLKMATQILCSYFKFGYCKHREYCQKRHVKELCELSSCDIANCDKRHPIKCKFYRYYGQCKFDPCMFSHKRDDDGIDALKKEMEMVVENIRKVESSKKYWSWM